MDGPDGTFGVASEMRGVDLVQTIERIPPLLLRQEKAEPKKETI